MSSQILISLFNHKGGVSKTTTTFNLGWTLANEGIKTLIVDTDPQCNLTAYVLGLQNIDDLESFYNNKENDNIYDKISEIIEGSRTNLKPVSPCRTLNDNLLLVPSHLSMSELDISLVTGITSGKFLPFAKQFVGAFHKIIRLTAQINKCEIVLVDMSPNAGAMNRSILMSSDYFVIPSSPDFFSYQAIQSLSKMIPKWKDDFHEFRNQSTVNPLPEKPPRMLGVISQKYRPYTKKIPSLGGSIQDFFTSDETKKQGIAKSYKDWINKIQVASSDILAKSLKEHQMVIDEDLFKKHVRDESPYNLISIGDFNSLVALSQIHKKPVFALNDDELNFTGSVLKEMKKNQEHFLKIFQNLAIKICNLIQEDYSSGKVLSKNLN